MGSWFKERRIENIRKLKDNIDLWHKLDSILATPNKHLLCLDCPHNYKICDKGRLFNDCNDKHILTQEIKENIEELLIALLPSGSGLNYDWEFKFFKTGSITCKSFYHYWSDHYEQIMPVTVRIFRYKKNVYHVMGAGQNRQQATFFEKKGELGYKIHASSHKGFIIDVNDYLSQCMDDAFKSFIGDWELKVIDLKDIRKPYDLKY